MHTLTTQDLYQVSGGETNWGQLGAGAALIGVSVAIAATPVGWVGIAAASAASFGGGFIVGDSLQHEFERFYRW